MKYLKLLFLFIIVLVNSGISQIKSIDVIDSKTNKKIPFVNVVIKNTNKGWSGDEKGTVNIDFTQIELTDSLVFSAIGFDKKTIEYSVVHTLSRIKLTPSSVYLNEVKIKARRYKRARLGRKKVQKGGWFSGFNHKAPRDNTVARYIPNDLGADGIINELRIFIKYGSEFSFLVDALKIDELTGKPSSSLLKNPIEVVERKNKRWLTVSIKNQSISIPKNGFFISITKLRDTMEKAPLKNITYKVYYEAEKKHRIDTFFYKGVVLGATYEKENRSWEKSDSTWWNYWLGERFWYPCDTCEKQIFSMVEDYRYSNKQTLAVYANILYSKSARKYEENILDKEGVVSMKDQKKILSKVYKYPKNDKLLYPQGDVFQLFESIKRALDSNNMNYIAHHLLVFTYQSLEGFELNIDKKEKGEIIYRIENILNDRERLKLTKLDNGFYEFKFGTKIGGKLLLRNGEWKIMLQKEYR